MLYWLLVDCLQDTTGLSLYPGYTYINAALHVHKCSLRFLVNIAQSRTCDICRQIANSMHHYTHHCATSLEEYMLAQINSKYFDKPLQTEASRGSK